MENLNLFSVVVQIATKQHQEVGSAFNKELEEIISSNELDIDRNVPSWLLDFFTAILEGRETGRVKYSLNKNESGDVINFLAELEEILEADWDDYGEGIEIVFPKLKMYGHISRESGLYEVRGI